MNMEEKEYTEENTICKTSALKWISQILSVIFNPFLVPLSAFILLFSFTYLNIMPLQYVLFVLSIVATFTILAPCIFILLYKWTNKWSMKEISERKKRFIPYILTMMSYTTCIILMKRMHFPYYFSGIIVAALLCMIVCTLFNFKWRISIHLVGCGMLIGGLLAYSFLFYFNPIWWLCAFILLSGIQGTARISYHQHTLFEVIAGFVIGMFCGIIGILFI
jgi:hypothetical protein